MTSREMTYPNIADAMVEAASKGKEPSIKFTARETDDNRQALDQMEEIFISKLPQKGMTHTRQLSPEGEVIFQIK